MIISPKISIATAKRLVEDLYKVKVTAIKELNGYVDKNYHVETGPESTNPHLNELSKHGYILKILNEQDSKTQHADAEHKMARLLTKDCIMCPIPEINIYREEFSLEELVIENKVSKGEGECCSVHLVRLLKYIPGARLYDVPYTPDLLIQAGELIGRIDKTLQEFSHPALSNYDTVWGLANVPQLTEYIHAVTNENHKHCVMEVIDRFKKKVMPNFHKFQTGVIHGDYNDQNIIVDRCVDDNENNDKYKIRGVIDFGDARETYIVMEIAIGISHLMMESKNIDIMDVGGYMLHGYYKHITLNEYEKDAMKTLVSGRYCQSLVLGAHSYMQNPGNEYLLLSANHGWEQLLKIWNTPNENLYAHWECVMNI